MTQAAGAVAEASVMCRAELVAPGSSPPRSEEKAPSFLLQGCDELLGSPTAFIMLSTRSLGPPR